MSSRPMSKFGKVVVWILVAFGTLSAAFVALGMWGLSNVGYAVPGGDLPRHLEGRWDWASAKTPCSESAHVISFSDDRQTMRIIQPASGADTAVTTIYDVVEISPERVRGAIRGETRQTSKGIPIVWDLVMITADQYQWQQTDWSFWQFTGAVRRCPPLDDDAASSDSWSRNARVLR